MNRQGGDADTVSLNTFDIKQEAPVTDLISAKHAIKGVPWGDLCFDAGEGGTCRASFINVSSNLKS